MNAYTALIRGKAVPLAMPGARHAIAKLRRCGWSVEMYCEYKNYQFHYLARARKEANHAKD